MTYGSIKKTVFRISQLGAQKKKSIEDDRHPRMHQLDLFEGKKTPYEGNEGEDVIRARVEPQEKLQTEARDTVARENLRRKERRTEHALRRKKREKQDEDEAKTATPLREKERKKTARLPHRSTAGFKCLYDK